MIPEVEDLKFWSNLVEGLSAVPLVVLGWVVVASFIFSVLFTIVIEVPYLKST